ncbi:hypothetical protein SAMIE_1029510 [Sphingobium amiense]|uniref:2-hydroxyglutaryl-CoA dehydratase n=1 Tax=Sphingobium amiense TaxID=135719 RepID=A0A494WET4_9SPHN|nr:hypothetical protein [Sphingobium amiense]BBD99450.1 hypothetical protein SAMIE_1029510 [Sphingobium amiense]
MIAPLIAYVGPDLPHDLLTASGRCAGALGWNIDRAMPAADRWLESKFPLWSRSILQDWADGVLDGHDAILFSRADDAAQRLYYYLCELRRQGEIRGPEPLIFDAATIARASSARHVEAAVRKLAVRLEVDESQLARAIIATNARRQADEGGANAGPSCLIAGTPPPDRRLHAMVEATGWRAAGPTLGAIWEALGPPVAEGGDPFAAVAAQRHRHAQGSRAFADGAAVLMEEARRQNARAVILWLAEEDEARLWDLPPQRAALDAAHIPALVLTRRDWRANGGEAEEIAAFLKGLAA